MLVLAELVASLFLRLPTMKIMNRITCNNKYNLQIRAASVLDEVINFQALLSSFITQLS